MIILNHRWMRERARFGQPEKRNFVPRHAVGIRIMPRIPVKLFSDVSAIACIERGPKLVSISIDISDDQGTIALLRY